jgi:hypothetical protein
MYCEHDFGSDINICNHSTENYDIFCNINSDSHLHLAENTSSYRMLGNSNIFATKTLLLLVIRQVALIRTVAVALLMKVLSAVIILKIIITNIEIMTLAIAVSLVIITLWVILTIMNTIGRNNDFSNSNYSDNHINKNSNGNNNVILVIWAALLLIVILSVMTTFITISVNNRDLVNSDLGNDISKYIAFSMVVVK